jgi:hypothetical protein
MNEVEAGISGAIDEPRRRRLTAGRPRRRGLGAIARRARDGDDRRQRNDQETM